MPAVPVFVAQLLAGFFLSAKARWQFLGRAVCAGSRSRRADKGKATSALSGLP